MEFQKIIAEVDFNYDSDKKRFGQGDRITFLNRFTNEEKQDVVGISLSLGHKVDDTIYIVLPYEEFVQKLASLTLSK